MLFLHTIGVRYETTLEQIERLVARIGAGLRAHPKVEVDDDMPRVRLAAFGASSIDIEARAYVGTTSVHEFMAVQAELLLQCRQRFGGGALAQDDLRRIAGQQLEHREHQHRRHRQRGCETGKALEQEHGHGVL